MNFLKLLMVIGVLGVTYNFWSEHKRAKLLDSYVQSSPSPGHFIPTAMPNEAKPGTVLIFAPVNCPSSAAKRADALASELSRMGIPTMRANRFSANVSNPSEEQKSALNRAASVLGGEIPAVFINGMGKANPSAEEVAAEYRRTQS